VAERWSGSSRTRSRCFLFRGVQRGISLLVGLEASGFFSVLYLGIGCTLRLLNMIGLVNGISTRADWHGDCAVCLDASRAARITRQGWQGFPLHLPTGREEEVNGWAAPSTPRADEKEQGRDLPSTLGFPDDLEFIAA
jgi:hypothetical protein